VGSEIGKRDSPKGGKGVKTPCQGIFNF